ncbi:class I SAM-dependent methyltransferase [Croceicoccus gelatinilyticus]|uniref:class I SAM-dependent methyltransferase n=1 Tax=Croceicoccus gelatinilyticus TaxID=2835536 RepID=UPI001BCCB6F9|nr:methyltransferase domain-containing protein [Croceicoccus gelatinilyticus]MBS7668473.1 methyltransferase domain-containing protein [Croceicoccus gelatinilyticus]
MLYDPNVARLISNALANKIDEFEVRGALTDDQHDFLAHNWAALEEVEQVWLLMDSEWQRTGAGYRPDQSEQMGRFYSSPVWLLNGIFTEIDPESRQHRLAIAATTKDLRAKRIADFGGGFGSLARSIKNSVPGAEIEVIEPFPSELARALAKKSGISYASQVSEDADLILAQDVLEHVTDPLGLFGELLSKLKPGNHIITANCFLPMIACHYPGALHLHFTFRKIAPLLGCRFVGQIEGAPHAEIYEKLDRAPNWLLVRTLERASKSLYPLIQRLSRAKRVFSSARP